MRVECYGQSAPQDGRTRNEDAFVILRGPVLVAAICDGAGNAEQAAKRSLRLFSQFARAAAPDQLLRAETWVRWVRQLDLGLLGGVESTFVGVAVVENELVGAATGDSRAYWLGAGAEFRILTAGAGSSRLGSGEVTPLTIRRVLEPRDIVLLMSDGAWSPLTPYLLQRAVRRATGQHFSDVPGSVLQAAGRTGRWDDMTVVALRLSAH
jgi:serine/threonine protein phosphatase PrpC